MRSKFAAIRHTDRCFVRLVASIRAVPTYTIEQAVARRPGAQSGNRDCAQESNKARTAAGLKPARDFFRALSSTGLYDKRQQQRKSHSARKITTRY